MLKDTFCSSPWFHLRLRYNGDFLPCRWGKTVASSNIKTTSLLEYYNSDEMKNLRLQLLNGEAPDMCKECHYQDQYKKTSGRIRQLLKSGISYDEFSLTARSSSHYEHFLHSSKNNGHSNYYPVDLQIDLGNVCNSACIMCNPFASSKLANDYTKLHKSNPFQFYQPVPYKSWTQDPETLDKFIQDLQQLPDIKYIHLLGGETLYDPAFYKICDKLIESGISKNIILGTTTNGTVYDDRLEKLICQFKEFHLGISIETVSPLNDYIRYPGDVNVIVDNIKKFLALRSQSNLYVNLRITPNIFTMYEIDELITFMVENNVAAESCNILTNPAELKMELMPDDIRQEIIAKLKSSISKHNLYKSNITNTRQSSLIQEVVGDVVFQYLNFMENYNVPDDADALRRKLVTFLKSFESIRDNSILTYAPRYTEFLRTYGY